LGSHNRHGIVVKEHIPGVPIVTGSLNGSHGEWTNGDDMGDKQPRSYTIDEALDVLRLSKVASNHQHHSNTNNPHKKKKKDTSSSDGSNASRRVNKKKPEDKPPETHVDGLVAPIAKPVSLITTHVCVDFELCNTPTGPVLRHNLLEDTFIGPQPKVLVKNHGLGWYQVSSDPLENLKSCYPSQACEIVMLGSYTMRDINGNVLTHAARAYTVFTPLLNAARQKCRGSTADAHFCNGIYSVLSSYSSEMTANVASHPYLRETCEYVIDSKHYITCQALNSTELIGKIMNNGSIIGNGDFGRERAAIGISIRHGLNNHGQMWTTSALPTSLARDWLIRDDLEIKYHGQACLVDEKYISFGADVLHKPIGHRTHFVQFMGNNCFIDGQFTARSMEDSIKRLVGQRTDEAVYRTNALSVAKWYRQTREHKTQSGVDYMSIGITALIGQRHSGSTELYLANLDNEQYPWKAPFILAAIKRFTKLTKPGLLEAAVDFAKNKARNTYYGVWKLFNEHNPWENRGVTSSLPHIKQQLRIRIHKGMPLDDEIGLKSFCTTIKSQMKTEWMKPGKSIRLTADMGDTSIYASSLPAYVKIATHGITEYVINGVSLRVFVYSKPTPGDFELIAAEMAFAYRTDNCIFIAIASDDSCYAGRLAGVSFMANVDVTSNDSSQETLAFAMVYAQQHHIDPDLAKGLLRGVLLPFKVVSPTDPLTSIEIKFHGPMEPSGHPDTTVYNNAGSFLIAIHAFVELCMLRERSAVEGYSIDEDMIQYAIVSGARHVGHLVTYERCSNMAEIQFLKRSFAWSSKRGCFIPVMNVAAYLRSLGTIINDLECKNLGMLPQVFSATPPDERMKLFVSSVVAGWRHESGNSILQALRNRFDARITEEVRDKYVHFTVSEQTEVSDYSDEEFGDSWLMDRYKLSSVELQEIVQAISHCELGDEFHLAGLTKIYEVDYSLKSTEDTLRLL